jgi:hypothetical protein
MTAKYALHEVVTYIGDKQASTSPTMFRYLNRQCIIVNPLSVYSGEPYLRYGVRFSDDVECWVIESALQKYRAPEDQVRQFRCDLKGAGSPLDKIISDIGGPADGKVEA